MVVGLMELISEVQVFAEKSGLGTALIEKFIGDMFGPVAESYSKRYVFVPIPTHSTKNQHFIDSPQVHMHPHLIHHLASQSVSPSKMQNMQSPLRMI